MALIRFHKVTTLPGTLEANSFYYVENGSFAESYLTNNAGVAKALGNTAMINSLIQAALNDYVSNANAIEIVTDIAARDALITSLDHNAMILVIDASADSTVDAGSALYAYSFDLDEIYKVAEYESMDVTIQWSSIQGKPASSAAAIDNSVSMAHTHANKAVLDALTDGGANGLLYNGQGISTQWATLNW